MIDQEESYAVNTEGKIIEQENHFDPRDITNPGWQAGAQAG
jgi:hypothetical protein